MKRESLKLWELECGQERTDGRHIIRPDIYIYIYIYMSACPHAHFITRGPAPWDRLVRGSAPLRAPSRTCSKGACPLAFPPPRPVRGAREVVLARSQGNHSPKKRPPPFFTLDLRLGSPLPHPVRGEVEREPERGRPQGGRKGRENPRTMVASFCAGVEIVSTRCSLVAGAV